MPDQNQARCTVTKEQMAVIDRLSQQLPVPHTGRRTSAVHLLVRYGLAHLEEARIWGRMNDD